MSRIIAVKIKKTDGTYSEEIPVSALAENIGWDEGHSLKDIIGNVNPSTEQPLKTQITALNNSIQQINSKKATKVELSNLNTALQSQLQEKVSLTQFIGYQQDVNTVFSKKVSNSAFNAYKDEVDARFDNLVGTTQITELQNQIDQKADSQDLEAIESQINNCASAADLASHIGTARQTTDSINQNIAKIKDTIGTFNDGDKISQKILQIESNATTLAKKTELTDAVSSLQSSINTKANTSDLNSKVNESTFESRVLDLIKNSKSHIGQIIMSTTLDTQAKVIAEYGGKAWTRIQGRFLLGAGSTTDGITSNVTDTGGSTTHSHKYGVMVPTYYGSIISADASSLAALCVQDYDENNNYSWGAHDNVRQSASTNPRAFSTKANTGLINASRDVTCSAIYSSGDSSYQSSCPPYYSCYIWRRTK